MTIFNNEALHGVHGGITSRIAEEAEREAAEAEDRRFREIYNSYGRCANI